MPDLLVEIQETKEAITLRTRKREEKLDEARAIYKTCVSEGRNPNPDDKKKADALEVDAKSDAEFIARLTASNEELEGRASLLAAAAREHAGGRRSEPDQLTTSARVVGERAEDDPNRGFKNDRNFFLNVMEAGKTPDRASKLLLPLKVKPETRAAGSDEQSTFSDPYGGYLIPEGFSPDLMKLDPEDDPMGAFTTRIPMTAPVIRVPYRVDKDHTTSVSGGLTVSRREESAAIVASRMELAQLRLEAHSLFGLAYSTEEVLADSPISFAAMIAAGFADEFTSAIIDERINGTGAGEYQGALTTPCKITIAKETDQDSGSIVLDNVIKMVAQCWRPNNAIWLANQTCLTQLAKLNQAVGTGGQVMWWHDARQAMPGQLVGLPLVFTEHCKALGTEGDLILANWSQYLEGIYQPLRSAESIHVRFENHTRTFKFWMRNAGHWWWDAALTPKNGDPLSPVVTLATRA